MPPTALAEGTLAKTPFAHVMLSIHRRQLDGTLAVWPDEERAGQDRILFRRGSPVAGRLLDGAETLERGMLPIFRRALAPYAFYEGDLVGSADGVIASPCDTLALVAAALRGGGRDDVVAQVLGEFDGQRVRIGGGFDASMFRLIPKESAFLDLVRAEPDSVASLMERSGDEKTARRILYLLAITRNLERVRASPDVSEAGVSAEFAPRMTFTPNEPGMPSIDEGQGAPISSPRPALGPSSSFSAARPVAPALGPSSSFSAARPVVPASTAAAPRPKARGIEGPAIPPPPPAGLTPELTARWTDLAERVTRSDGQNYFEVLGVEESSGPEQVRSAYFDAVKKVHPDRLPADFAPLRTFVERLFTLMTEAKETLEVEEKRMKYIRNVRGGGGTPASDRKMVAVLTAAHELEKATVLSNLGKWNEVLAVLEDAKAFDATQPDIYALEAWTYFNLLGQHPNATLEHVLILTERVLVDQKDHYHERALYTRGLALKKQGRNEDALSAFKRIVERNPRNLDAAREVRLFEMRNREGARADGAGGSGPKDAGLFSKLFGGKK